MILMQGMKNQTYITKALSISR